MNDPIAYTYDADVHCPDCSFSRFGRDLNGFVPETERDSDGNPIGVIAPWDSEIEHLSCGTCHVQITL